MYTRKTYDEYSIEGYYGSRYGWEEVCTEDNLKDAKRTLREYNENEPQYPHRIKKHRIPIN